LTAVTAQADIGVHGKMEVHAPYFADFAPGDSAPCLVMGRMPAQLMMDHQHAIPSQGAEVHACRVS